MQYMYNGDNVTNESFTDTDGNSYPANWVRLATREQRDAIGIVENSDPLPLTLGSEVPASVSMRQARLMLHSIGLLEEVDAIIINLGTVAVIEWQYAQTVDRNNFLIAMVQQAHNMSDAEIDNFFRTASLL